jgi:hypothetical protein
MSRIAAQLKPPTFKQPYLQSLLLCSCFRLSDNALSKLIKPLDEDDTAERETKFDSSRGPAWIRIRVGRRVEGDSKTDVFGRYQVDCSLESRFSSSKAQQQPPNNWDEVRQYLELALKQEVDVICCQGRFFIPKTELPIEGFTRLLLGVSAGVGKAKLNLTGASFEVQGHQPIDEVRWKLRPHKGKGDVDELDLSVSAFPKPKRFRGDLEKVAQILFNGVQELVITTGE